MIRNRLGDWRDKMHRRIGEELFRRARADYEAGRSTTPSRAMVLAKGFAGLIVITPYLVIVTGLSLLVFGAPNIGFILIGLLLSAGGYFAIPSRPKLTGKELTRDDLPEFFALCDAVSERLGAQGPTKVAFDNWLSAYYSEVGEERILGFGLGLWAIAIPQERIAILAHEFSHQLNGDIARTGMLHRALVTLQNWYDLLGVDPIIDHEGYLLRERGAEDVIADWIMGTGRFIVDQIWLVLLRLYYADSQRSEYLADAISTRAGGVAHMQSALTKFGLTPLIEREITGMVPQRVPSGAAFYERLNQAIVTAPEEERERLINVMVEERHFVDMSHPPTFQRIAFLSDLSEPDLPPVAYPGAALDEEVAPHLEQAGQNVLEELREQ